MRRSPFRERPNADPFGWLQAAGGCGRLASHLPAGSLGRAGLCNSLGRCRGPVGRRPKHVNPIDVPTLKMSDLPRRVLLPLLRAAASNNTVRRQERNPLRGAHLPFPVGQIARMLLGRGDGGKAAVAHVEIQDVLVVEDLLAAQFYTGKNFL